MTKISEGRWKLLSIVLIGSFVTAVGAIAFAPTQVPQSATAQGAAYVPFRAVNPAPITCDTPGGFPETDVLKINGGSDFMVTGVVLQPSGVDEVADSVIIASYSVDLAPGKFLVSVDFTGSATTSRASDIMGLPTLGAKGELPTTIAAVGAGADDIRIFITCDAAATSDLVFKAGSVEVYGWKLSGDTITVGLTETP